jgi:osmotically-inducible protein OsmY
VTCRDHEGVLTLAGCVPKYFLKQMAQTIAGSVEGVEEIVNRIHVDPTAFHSPSRSDDQST